MSRILILGGLGAIGSNLARYFNDHEHCVHVMDNLARYGVHHNLADFKKRGIGFTHGDVRCPEDFERINYDFDTVIDCAAQPTAVDGYDNPVYDYTNNTHGLFNTLEYVRRNHLSLIFFSTNKVYSADVANKPGRFEDTKRWQWQLDGDRLCGETMPGFDPVCGFNEGLTLAGGGKSVYGASKAAADIFVREYSDAFGVPAIVNRFSCLAGPYQWGKPEQGWVTWWVIAAVLGLPLNYFGWQGKQVRDILFTPDICRLIERQISDLEENGAAASDVYNVGGGHANTLSLIEATTLVENMTGKVLDTEYIDEVRASDHCIYISDINKVSKKFKWVPQTCMLYGFREIYEWVKENETILRGMYT
jgi:CDP-paratose 2-epimerase